MEGLARLSSRACDKPQEPGVPDTTIQAILRHENVSTTQRFYIKTAHQDAMDCNEKVRRRTQVCSSCAADGELIVGKLLKTLEPTIGLEPMTCRLRIDWLLYISH